MHADAHFVKGRSHRICEDYALAGSIGDRPFVVLCDGCSSSPHTDFGARILAHSFKDVLATLQAAPRRDLATLAVAQAHVRAQSLGLDATSLDCTLLAIWDTDVGIQVVQTGDGGIVCKRQDGDIWIWYLEFSSGAPYYLSYALDSDRRKNYFKEYGREEITSTYVATDGGQFTLKSSSSHFNTDGGPYTAPIDRTELYNLESIGVFSDGLSTFRDRKTLEQKDMKHVIREMMNFKMPKGAFVQRRMKRVLKNYEQAGIEPEDDVSLAAIYL